MLTKKLELLGPVLRTARDGIVQRFPITISLRVFYKLNAISHSRTRISIDPRGDIVFVWSQYDGTNIEQWAMVGTKTKKPNLTCGGK